MSLPSEIPGRIICQICQEVAQNPKSCSKCKYWSCSVCIDDWVKSGKNTCMNPSKCQQPAYQVPKEAEVEQVAYIKVDCTCDKHEKMLLGNNLEHLVNIESPHICFNYYRCKQFGVFSAPETSVVFCSKECYEVYCVAQKKTDDLWKNIHNDLKKPELREGLKKSNFLPEKEAFDKLAPVGAGFALDLEHSDPRYKVLGANQFEYEGTDRFFKTAYFSKKIEKGSLVILISSDSKEFFKVGFAKEKKQGKDYCFSDDDNGEAFFTIGQMRTNSPSYGQQVTVQIKGEAALCIKANFAKKTFTVEEKNSNIYETILPFSEKVKGGDVFFAVAFKKPSKFKVVIYEFDS